MRNNKVNYFYSTPQGFTDCGKFIKQESLTDADNISAKSTVCHTYLA